MRITFLGTNGWYDTKTGNTICVLIETRKEYIILDAGNGFYKIDQHITKRKPVYLFLSHFHLDHVIGLHTLAKFNFSQGIDVYGPPGIKRFFNTVISRLYTMPIARLKTKIRLHELNQKCRVPLDVKFKKLSHPVICYGFRLTLENKVISYCTDTGICKNLCLLGRQADLLITECSLRSRQKSKNWAHLNPEMAARIAKKAAAKRLVLMHFDSAEYTKLAERKKAQNAARKIFRSTLATLDGTKILM